MDAILSLPPTLPPHDYAPLRPLSGRTIAEWPAGTFVENLTPLADGSFAISVLSEARLDRVWPDGRKGLLAQFDAPVTGSVRIGGYLYIAVGVPDQLPWSIRRVDLATGTHGPVLEVEGAVFINGIAALSATALLANESVHGQILRIDLARRESSVWIEDDRLKPAAEAPFLPGANGLKLFDGHAYVSSNGKALFGRVPIRRDGTAGSLEIIAERLRADDFAFDSRGNAYLTTHIGHGIDRLTPDGERVTLAGPAQGLAGSTACAFGVTDADRRALYVTTTGGIIGPVDGLLQPARLVRIDVGATGVPVTLEGDD